MKPWAYVAKTVSVTAVAAVCALAPSARAQPAFDVNSQSVLTTMAQYVGGLQSFSTDYAAIDEVVTTEGQKLQFLHSGEVLVQRPNKLYVIRRGAAGEAELFLDGKTLTLYVKNANAYLQLDASSIDLRSTPCIISASTRPVLICLSPSRWIPQRPTSSAAPTSA